ncbi:amidohydrolase family protein [Pseudomonas sp. S31]|uniref:amidohydrolase family protein n=1 Tax=Pseudomonas sp. S31 TaxID=1564473 RepID=UPI0019122E9F|nr:amidohydrolase family protein [Pseudomonas sp. S31]
MDPKLGDLEGFDVLIMNGTIREIGKSLPAAGSEVLDGAGMIVLPGMIDTHWHLWNSLLRSSAPIPGGPAFFETQQRTSKRFTPALTELSVRLGLAEAINAGFTTVNSWSHNIRSPEFAQAELKALAASGIGARLWYGYAQDLPQTSPMDFADIQRVSEHIQQTARGRLDLGLAVRGPERTGPEIWIEEFEFAAKHSLPISTHIAVTKQMQKKRAIQQLASRSLLLPKVQLVHATHADQQDLESIRESGASVCLTPLTEMRVGYGLPPVAALHLAKLPVSLGVDTLVLGGNANPFMLMQTCLNLAIATTGDEQTMTARDVLHWATQGAADIMGWGDKTGSITVGKRADMIMINARNIGMFPVIDPAATIVQSASPADVTNVIANGRLVKRDGVLLGLDLHALAEEAREGVRHLLKS